MILLLGEEPRASVWPRVVSRHVMATVAPLGGPGSEYNPKRGSQGEGICKQGS